PRARRRCVRAPSKNRTSTRCCRWWTWSPSSGRTRRTSKRCGPWTACSERSPRKSDASPDAHRRASRMDSSLRTSASGMVAQQRMIDVIANNLANVNTTAFKRSRVSFEDVLYETVQGARITNPQTAETVRPVQIGKGVRIGAVLRLHTEGAPEQTGRPLDVAIQGDGFFQVQRADGTTGYTRDGGFTLSDGGTLVTSDGYPLLPEVAVPQDATSVSISPNGVVSVTTAGANTPTEIGRLELARFLNPNGLLAVGQNQYAETPASGEPIP